MDPISFAIFALPVAFNLYNTFSTNETQKKISQNTIGSNEDIARQQREISLQIAKSNIDLWTTEGQINRDFQGREAQLNRAFQSSESLLNRQVQMGLGIAGLAGTAITAGANLVNAHFERRFRREQAQLQREHEAGENEVQRAFQRWENKLSREHQEKLTEYVQEWENLRQNNRFEFEMKMADKRYDKELELLRRQQNFSVELALSTNHLLRENGQYERMLNNYPLRIYPITLFDDYQTYIKSNKQLPVMMLFSPLSVPFDRFINSSNAVLPQMTLRIEEELSAFIDRYYRDKCRFLSGAWDTNRMKGETAATHLHNLLKPIPTSILEFEAEDDFLNFRVFSWNAGSESYSTTRILSGFNIRNFLNTIQKEYAQEWGKKKRKLPPEKISKLVLPSEHQKALTDHQIDDYNLRQLELENECASSEVKLDIQYLPSRAGMQKFSKYLSVLSSVIAGLVLDAYCLICYGAVPKIPSAAKEFYRELSEREADDLMRVVIKTYESIAREMYLNGSNIVHDVLIDIAYGLTELPNVNWSKEIISLSLRYWLLGHDIEIPEDTNLLDLVYANLTISDQRYVEKVNQCLKNLNFPDDNCLDIAKAYYNRAVLGSKNLDNLSLVIDDLTILINLSKMPDAYLLRMKMYLKVNQLDEAYADAHEYLKLSKNPEVLGVISMIDQLISSGKLNEAFLTCLKLLQSDCTPKQTEILGAIARVFAQQAEAYSSQGRYEEAVGEYDKAIALGMDELTERRVKANRLNIQQKAIIERMVETT